MNRSFIATIKLFLRRTPLGSVILLSIIRYSPFNIDYA